MCVKHISPYAAPAPIVTAPILAYYCAFSILLLYYSYECPLEICFNDMEDQNMRLYYLWTDFTLMNTLYHLHIDKIVFKIKKTAFILYIED